MAVDQLLMIDTLTESDGIFVYRIAGVGLDAPQAFAESIPQFGVSRP